MKCCIKQITGAGFIRLTPKNIFFVLKCTVMFYFHSFAMQQKSVKTKAMGSNVNDENLCQLSPIIPNLITLTKCYHGYEFFFSC